MNTRLNTNVSQCPCFCHLTKINLWSIFSNCDCSSLINYFTVCSLVLRQCALLIFFYVKKFVKMTKY